MRTYVIELTDLKSEGKLEAIWRPPWPQSSQNWLLAAIIRMDMRLIEVTEFESDV